MESNKSLELTISVSVDFPRLFQLISALLWAAVTSPLLGDANDLLSCPKFGHFCAICSFGNVCKYFANIEFEHFVGLT